MKKKKPLNIKILIIILLSLIILVLSGVVFCQYKKAHTSFLESVTILGKEFKLEPGIFVYEFTIDNPEIKAVANGCELPYTYKISKVFKKMTNGSSGLNYFVDGESYADFNIVFIKKDNNKVLAKYYFYINFTSPLKIAKDCR
jgi:hypothetical protein